MPQELSSAQTGICGGWASHLKSDKKHEVSHMYAHLP